MKNIYKILFVLLFLIFIIPSNVMASSKVINIHIFYGQGCPHCAAEEKMLNELVKEDKDIKVYKHEVWYDFSNQKLWADVQRMLGKPASGVPYTVIGNQVLSGYSEVQTERDIKTIVKYYEGHNYRDLVGEQTGLVKENKNIKLYDGDILSKMVYVPILGNVDPQTISLPIVTAVMGLIDGFNPCAIWILFFLITMLIGMKDKKKLWILGLSFIITSGLVYLLFMVAWLNFAMFATKISIIRDLIALVALGAGVWNLKNFFKRKEDGCEVVGEKKRKSIINRIKDITSQNKFILAIVGVVLLAASVNVIELLCSIGLPMMFTNILAMNDLSAFQSGLYMLLYIFFFLLIDIIIFVAAILTFKVTAFSTKFTKYSHLLGGIVMLLIGLLLLFAPSVLMFNF